VGTRIYRVIGDVDRFQAFLLDEADPPVEAWLFDGTPRARSWQPPAVYVDQLRLEVPDIWTLVGAAVLIFDERIEELLGPELYRVGELLPIFYQGQRLRLLNILLDINCLDPTRRDWEVEPEPYVFIEHRLPESGLFKVPETDTAEILCVERDDDVEPSFRHLVARYELSGLQFQLLSST
jgi:hypothetical protein